MSIWCGVQQGKSVTKRNLLFKSKEYGGLGAIDLGIKLKITFVKNITAAINRKAPWVEDGKMGWKKRRGRARNGPYYKLVYSDFITELAHLFKYGGFITYNNLT